MKLTLLDIAKMIDLSAVQAENDEEHIKTMVYCAKKYHCIAVYALPGWIPILKQFLGENNRDIVIGGPVGFPSGGESTSIKVAEAEELIKMGCGELDIVINIGKLLSRRYEDVYEDLRAVIMVSDGIPIKVILECHYLSDELILNACDIAIKAGADWIKTGTGWAKTGATLENISLIKSHVRDSIKIKASGGIKDLSTLLGMYERGARRFGIGLNSGIGIFEQVEKLPNQLVNI
ncbi:MAG TPA: deoxyribose-phosphate aldolase [Anaerolineae bacterium]|nr:deoxyribose-phosphate aldolase [Anaerolineae bacterium]